MIPDMRGYVEEPDGSLRQETDEEFRAYLREGFREGPTDTEKAN